MTQGDIAASVRARLLNRAKAEGTDFNQMLVRYALERVLYRISQSAYSEQFLLKGAMLFALWYNMPHRPTRDIDLLGYGKNDPDSIVNIFREIVSITVEDGIYFDAQNISATEIQKEAGYSGVRVNIIGELSRAECRVQIDIGFGDAVTPEALIADYPSLLTDIPAPRIKTYPVYTVIAEKLHAIVVLGMANSRMKDYFDLWVLLDRESLNDEILSKAVSATFLCRKTPIPSQMPLGLSEVFVQDKNCQIRWQAFLKKNNLGGLSLDETVSILRSRLYPVLESISVQGEK